MDKAIDKMALYYKSPIFVQNLMTTAQGYLYKKQRYGKAYKTAMEEYTSRDYGNENELKEYQYFRFCELVRYAYNNSPFYKEFYKGLDIEKILAEKEIEKLPVLEKETVRQHLAEMYTIPESEALESNTSGTTGKSMRFLFTSEDFQRRMAYLDAFKLSHGYIPMKMKRASFSSAKVIPPDSDKVFWRDNLAIKQRLYSGYHCQGDNIPYYIDDLNKYKPQSMDGYPSAMYEIANYIVNHNITLDFVPIAIFPTAETLLPHYKTIIEKAFRCPVRDQYASSEGAPFITECKCGKLHACMDTGIIEFTGSGKMLVTCFETHGTPLIRYDIGDCAFLAEDQSCSCGTKMPVVDRIEGRTLDYLYSPEKGKISAIYMSLVSADFSNCMKAMQFVQNTPDEVDVYLETDDNYDISMNKIIEYKLHYSLGDNMNIRIHTVREIKKEKSGKFRLIINNLDVQKS